MSFQPRCEVSPGASMSGIEAGQKEGGRRPYQSPAVVSKKVLVPNLFAESTPPGGPGGNLLPDRPRLPPRGA
jgi:hypothetical protein